MHCPNCGKATKEHLNFCNGCGAKLSRTEDKAKFSVAHMLSVALSLIGFFGFGSFIGLIAILVNNDVTAVFIAVISLAYLGALFGICYLILRQIANLSATTAGTTRPEKNQLNPASSQTAKLDAVNVPLGLEEARQPFVSVTEHTTRTLDQVPVNRRGD